MENSLVTPLNLGIAWAVTVPVFAWVGRAQRRDLGASAARLWLVAAVLAAIVFAPAVPALLFGEKLDHSWTGGYAAVLTEGEFERLEPDARKGAEQREIDGRRVYLMPPEDPIEVLGTGYSGWHYPVDVVVTLLLTASLLLLALLHLLPVRRLLGQRVELLEVRDPAILDEVAAIAQHMSTAAPRLLTWRSAPGDVIQAVATCTLAPIIVATDVVLDRLSEDETKAILAHEMAHVARRGIWRDLAFAAAATVFAALLSGTLFASVAIAFGVAACSALNLHNQSEELACDLLAARTAGFAPTARALNKIHAANSPPCSPAVKRLWHATQSHPSETLRRAHLARHAPPDERAEISYDRDEARLHRRTTRRVRLTLAAILAFGIWSGFDERLKWFGVTGLAAVVLVPPVITGLTVLRPLRDGWRLGYLRVPWGKLARLSLYLSSAPIAVHGWLQPWAWPTWLVIAACAGTLRFMHRRNRHFQRIDEAVRANDFGRALALLDELPPRVRRRPALRTRHAELLAADRRDEAAVAELDALARERPRFWPGQLLRCHIVSWRDPQRALQIVDMIDAAVPHVPSVAAYRAACLARLGRFDEADAVATRAMELDPYDAHLHVIRAIIASRNGDVPSTAELIRRAEARDPASTPLLLAKARFALGRRDLEAAGAALRVAEEAVENNRTSLLMFDLDVLKRRYAEAAGGPA